MRYAPLFVAAALCAAPAFFAGCDRTASTETTHTDSGPNGTTVTQKKTTTDLDNGSKTTEVQKDKTVTNNP